MLPQNRPGDRKPGYTHFRYVSTANGAQWHAYTAGSPSWFDCHTKGRTKPCLHVMTAGELPCERCAESKPIEVIGYLPLYREIDARPVMVILHEEQRERADVLRLHSRVLVGREIDKADGVWVAPALKPTPAFHSTLQERNRPADLTETLLRLWGIPALVDWYRKNAARLKAEATPITPLIDGLPAGSKELADKKNRDFAQAVVRARERGAGFPKPEPATLGEVLPVLRNGKGH